MRRIYKRTPRRRFIPACAPLPRKSQPAITHVRKCIMVSPFEKLCNTCRLLFFIGDSLWPATRPYQRQGRAAFGRRLQTSGQTARPVAESSKSPPCKHPGSHGEQCGISCAKISCSDADFGKKGRPDLPAPARLLFYQSARSEGFCPRSFCFAFIFVWRDTGRSQSAPSCNPRWD